MAASMDMDRYQEVSEETAVYPHASSGNATALAYVALGLTGEAGEIANKVKKVLRDNGGQVTNAVRDQLAAELGDVLWYVAQLATELDLDLSHVARHNLAKLSSRSARGTLQGSGDDR